MSSCLGTQNERRFLEAGVIHESPGSPLCQKIKKSLEEHPEAYPELKENLLRLLVPAQKLKTDMGPVKSTPGAA